MVNCTAQNDTSFHSFLFVCVKMIAIYTGKPSTFVDRKLDVIIKKFLSCFLVNAFVQKSSAVLIKTQS